MPTLTGLFLVAHGLLTAGIWWLAGIAISTALIIGALGATTT